LFITLLDLFPVVIVAVFGVKLDLQLCEEGRDVFFGQRFGKVAADVQLDRFARVVELVVTGDEPDADGRILAADYRGQLDAVDIGHLDVGEHNLGRVLVDQFERVIPVARRADHSEPALLGDLRRNAPADLVLVVNQDDLVGCSHGFPPERRS